MGKDYSICVGAVGFGGGVWHSPDGGDNWNRIRDPFPLGSQVRGMAVYPDNPNRILAGSEHGIYRTEDCGATWEKMWSPMEGMPIWSIAIDPQNTDNIFVGIKPAALFRSQDGGQSWSKLSVQMAQECHIGPPMVTMLMVDPQDSRTVWAGVEVDGVYRSLDGGDTWTHVQGGVHPDIHGMAISPEVTNKVLASTPREIYATTDMGESWQSVVTTDKFGPTAEESPSSPTTQACCLPQLATPHIGPTLHGRRRELGDAAPAGTAEEHRTQARRTRTCLFAAACWETTAIGSIGAIQRSTDAGGLRAGRWGPCRWSRIPTSGTSSRTRRTRTLCLLPACWERSTGARTPGTRGTS